MQKWLQGWPDDAAHVVVAVETLQLAPRALASVGAGSEVFVMYSLLPAIVPAPEQCTRALPAAPGALRLDCAQARTRRQARALAWDLRQREGRPVVASFGKHAKHLRRVNAACCLNLASHLAQCFYCKRARSLPSNAEAVLAQHSNRTGPLRIQAYDVSTGHTREEAARLLQQPKALLLLCLAVRADGSQRAAQIAFAEVDLKARAHVHLLPGALTCAVWEAAQLCMPWAQALALWQSPGQALPLCWLPVGA